MDYCFSEMPIVDFSAAGLRDGVVDGDGNGCSDACCDGNKDGDDFLW